MKKKLLLFLAALTLMLLLVSVLTVSASAETYSGTCGAEGDNLTWTLDTSTGVLNINGTGDMMDYSYLSSSSSSSAPWYSYRASIKTVNIPDSVTSIGEWAFYQCESLTSVTIPDSVTSIGDYAFSDCRSLTSVTIPDSVTSIGNYAFEDCDSLTSVTIGDSVTSIGSFAFYNTAYYNDASNWENGVLYIGKYLIEAKTTLSGHYDIKDGTLCIGSHAFSNCTSLTSVTIGGSVTSIGYGAFSYCRSLTSVTIGDSVTSIGDDAFHYCSNLTSVTIGGSVTSIGGWAFSNCSNLMSVTIGDSVTSIGGWAFAYCSSLKSVTIPKGVTSIGRNPFSGCSALESITVEAGNTVYHSKGNCLIDTADKLLVLGCKNSAIPADGSVTSIGSFAFYYCTSLMSVTIPDSVTSIGDSAFSNCTSLTSVTIPKGVTSIGRNSFVGCSALESITVEAGNTVYHSKDNCLIDTADKLLVSGCKNSIIPTDGSVTSIGSLAFYYCTSLMSVTIPDSVTSIGSSAFSSCTSLTSVTIGDSVTSIGSSAFYSCTSLTSVTIPDSVTSIGEWAFRECSSLMSVTIGGNVTSIGAYAFFDCSNLTSVTIPDSVTSIGDWAFYSCDSLTSVTIGDSVTSIGDYAFSHCTNLMSVTIGDNVTSIGDYAFRNCTSLTSVMIPDSVTSIGYEAFSNCTSLTSVTIGGSVTSIGYGAFSYCRSLTSVTIGDSVTSIGNNAFAYCFALKVVYLASPTVAKELTSPTSCGYLTCYAQTVVIASDITEIGSYVTSNFTFVNTSTVNGTAVTVYAKHSHAADSDVWQAGVGAKTCSVCTLTACQVGLHTREGADCEDSVCIYCGAFMPLVADHTRPENVPLCEDSVCVYCYEDIFAYVSHTRSTADEDCEDSFCIYCSMAMPALTSHTRPASAADCEDTVCTVCGTSLSPIADHDWNAWVRTTAIDNTGSATLKRVCKGNAAHTETRTVSAPRVESANLNISTDITLKYHVTVPEGLTDAYAVFSFNGVDYTVRKYTVDSLGRYVFAFTGITPQCLGDNVKITVYATYEGATLGAVKDNYSVKAYCENQLRKSADDEKLVRMVSDLLVYGATSQIYLDYKTDSLVSEGLTLTPSVCPTLPSSLQQKGLHGTADANVKWKSVGLRYTNTTTVFFRFIAADLDGLTVRVALGDRVAVYHAEDFKAEGNNVYRIDFNGVLATEFDETVKATFEKDGVAIGQYATYSVNSYLYTNQASANAALADLVKATYNYGKSARIYTGLE